jgi:hypothetical protein
MNVLFQVCARAVSKLSKISCYIFEPLCTAVELRRDRGASTINAEQSIGRMAQRLLERFASPDVEVLTTPWAFSVTTTFPWTGR